MYRIMCKSKIQHATVTKTNLKYMGSITIDNALLKVADILPGERVQVVNLNNGSRLETYVLKGRANSGTIRMNGGAALWAQVGDILIIISYAVMDNNEAKKHKPRVIFLNSKNRIKR